LAYTWCNRLWCLHCLDFNVSCAYYFVKKAECCGIPLFFGVSVSKTSLKLSYQYLSIIALVMGVYYPSIFAPFNSIDDVKMINDLLNLGSVNLKQLFVPNGTGQYYRPFLYLSFIADSSLWGLLPSFMHLENILLHGAAALMVFSLARNIVKVQQLEAPWLPLVCTLLFGLHPIATEPVNWVSGRTDVLAGLFVLASLLLFLKSLQQQSRWLGGCGAILLLSGCLCKETALFILPIILLWCLLPPKDMRSHASLGLHSFLFGIYTLAGSAYLLLRWQALSGGDKIVSTVSSGKASSGDIFNLWDLVRVSLKTCGFYFKKLFIPMPLNFGIVEIASGYLWLGALVCVGVLFCLYRRDLVSYLFVAAFCLAVPAFPLPVLKMTWTPVAERYVYIASAPFVIALALLFVRYLQPLLSPRAITIGVALLLGSAGVVTAQRNIIWQDNVALFEDTLRKSPNFNAAKNELAIALREQGRLDEAHALLMTNSGTDAQPSALNKVRVYFNQGNLEEAHGMLLDRKNRGIADTRESLDLLNSINEQRLRASVSNSKAQQQEISKEILESMKQLLAITGDPFYHYRIGMLQLRLGDKLIAKQSFEKAWLGAPTTSHYGAAAKKLAERL